MIVGRHDQKPVPPSVGDKTFQRFRFLARVGSPLGELYDGFHWHAVSFQIALDDFRHPCVGPQHASAGDNEWSYPHSVQIRGMKCAVSCEIVIAQNDYGVGMFGGFIDDPELAGHPHDRVANHIEECQKSQKNQQEEETEEDAAVFPPPQGFNSSERSRSAASSGSKPLK